MPFGLDAYWVLQCWVFHFGTSSFVGFLGYLLTLTILSSGSRASTTLIPLEGGPSIRCICLAVSVCFAIITHVLLDFIVNRW